MDGLFHFPDARADHPAVAAWLAARTGPLGALARHWLDALRACGDDVTELLHDGHPAVCVGQTAFAALDTFTAHANLSLYRGAELADPAGLLEGRGRFMRHVKLRPEVALDEQALRDLLHRAAEDMRRRTRSPP